MALATLTACTHVPRQTVQQDPSATALQAADASAQQSTLLLAGGQPVATLGADGGAEAPRAPQQAQQTEAKARIYEGTGVLLNPPRRGVALAGDAGEFNFEEAPITEVVHVMMGDVLKADYVLHQPISGSLTLSTKKTISKDRAISLLETALQANGLVMAQDSRGFYHIGRPDALKGIVPAPRLAGNGPLPPGRGAIVVPLEYIGAAEMAEILRPVMQADSLIRVDAARNLLVLAGTRTQAEGWLDLVKTFDVDLLKGMSVGIFPLKYASIADVQAAIRLVAGGGSGGAESAAGNQAAQQPAPQQTAAQRRAAAAAAPAAAPTPTVLPFLGAVKILPLERLNSIMVVTSRASHLEQVREWIERLDQPNDSAEAQLFVYGVQNGSAAHLAQVLGGIFGTAAGAAPAANSGVAPGLNAVGSASSGFNTSLNNNSGNNRFGSGTRLGSSTGQNQQAGSTVPVAMNLDGVRVIADPLNNAILVWGTRQEYQKIEATLKQLDRPPVQVVLEASIVEVSLTNDLQYGLRWAFNGSLGSGYQGTGGSPSLNSTGDSAITAANAAAQALGDNALGAFTYAVTRGDRVNALLQMLASRSLVKVLSSPSLLVLDNHTASITVGDQVPIITGTTYYSNSSGTTSNTVQYRDTGVILEVTPSVNAGDIVTLAVDQSVVSLGTTSGTVEGNPTFMQRQISSKVAVKSGAPIVLGGLIRENTTNSKDGIPGLVDVPVLGNAFGSTGNNNTRTELLVVITPTVVRSGEELRDAGEELRNRMQTLLKTRVEEIRRGGPVLPGEEELAGRILQPAAGAAQPAAESPQPGN